MSTKEPLRPPVPEPIPPGEGRWIARPSRTPWYLKLGASVALIAQLPNFLRMILESFIGKERSWIFLGSLIVLAYVTIVAIALVQRSRLKGALAARSEGGFGDQYPVEVAIVADGKHLGTDRGVLWFDEGLMGFSGRATSFVLAARDVWSQTAQTKNGSTVPPGAVQLVGAPVPSYLLIIPSRSQRKVYTGRLRRFRDEAVASDAERVWPPLEPYVAQETLAMRST